MTSESTANQFSRQKVLVIDDSDSIHTLVKVRLKHDALDVISASNGPSGIALSNSALPDLILLDVDMPGMDGFEVCQRLKDNPDTSHIPILFITTESTVEQKVRGLALGATDYVTKPFDPTELRARVHASLRGKKTHDRLARQAMVDDMTDLWNSIYLDRQINICVVEAKRFDRDLSCIVLDVDRLCAINQTYSESGGDEVLRVLAGRILRQCRAEDIAGRLGGGTFAILCRNISLSQATHFARRLWSTLASRPVIHRESSINFKCSFGVGSLTSEESINLLEDSRNAMERAKGFGGARIAVAQVHLAA